MFWVIAVLIIRQPVYHLLSSDEPTYCFEMISQVLEFHREMRNYRNDPFASESVENTEEQTDANEINKPLNGSDPEILIKPVPFLDDQWKNKVVIGCTIAVALEVLIVLLMVMYWKQIRWTLRKLSCPCDYFQHRRHEPMQRQEPTYETNIDLESDDSLPADQEMQIYAPSSHGDPDDRSIQGRSLRGGHGSSSTSHRYSNIGFPSEADSRINYYINDGDDDDDGGEDVRTHSCGETLESSHPQRFSNDVGEQGNMMQVYAIVHNITDEGVNNSR